MKKVINQGHFIIYMEVDYFLAWTYTKRDTLYEWNVFIEKKEISH